MRSTPRVAMAIGAVTLGVVALFACPRVAASQEIPAAEPTHSSFSSSLRPAGWFDWNGVRVRSGGRWASRPTWRPDWQAWFRCRMGFGSAPYGWGGYGMFPSSRSWPPLAWTGWDLGVGGWLWTPIDRFHHAHDLWHIGARGYLGFGSYGSACLYPFGWSYSFASGWARGLTRIGMYPPYSRIYGLADRIPPYIGAHGWLPPWVIDSHARNRLHRYPGASTRSPTESQPTDPEEVGSSRAYIDPVRTEAFDRSRWVVPAETREPGTAASGTSRTVSRAAKEPVGTVEPVRYPATRRQPVRPEAAGSRATGPAVATPRKPAAPSTTPRRVVTPPAKAAPRVKAPSPVRTTPRPQKSAAPSKTRPEKSEQ